MYERELADRRSALDDICKKSQSYRMQAWTLIGVMVLVAFLAGGFVGGVGVLKVAQAAKRDMLEIEAQKKATSVEAALSQYTCLVMTDI